MIKIQIVSKDARGEIYVLKNKEIEFANLEGFNAGAPRGGHHHPNPESKTVVYGELEYLKVDPKDVSSEVRSIVSKGNTIHIEPNIAHLFIAKTDSLLFGINYGKFEATPYEPYRKKVDDFLEKHKK